MNKIYNLYFLKKLKNNNQKYYFIRIKLRGRNREIKGTKVNIDFSYVPRLLLLTSVKSCLIGENNK